MIKECCVVFNTFEFKEKMKTFKKESEKFGLYILYEDKENIENFEEESKTLDPIFLHEGVIVFFFQKKDTWIYLRMNCKSSTACVML